MSKNIKLALIGLLIILTGLLYVWKKNKIDLLLDKLSRKQLQAKKLREKNRKIEIEIERLSRAERIKAKASDQLNMYSPDPETLTVTIDTNL